MDIYSYLNSKDIAAYWDSLRPAGRVKPDDLPYEMRPLKGFSLLMNGEMKSMDFLESYSNGMLDDLICYTGGRK